MRMPNGYGSVTKLSGKRRNPYMVRITVGVDEDTGDLVRKVLGYYPRRSDALSALAEYNKNPYDLSAHVYTFAEVYGLWSEQHFKGLSDSAIGLHKSAYKACSPLYELPFKDIKLLHLQQMMDSSGKSVNMKQRIKNLIGMMYTYAIRHEIVSKDYSTYIEIGKPAKVQKPHQPFTAEEIAILWQSVGKLPFVDTVLILIYTGMRAGELLGMQAANVHLDDQYMIGGSKTEAGKNRIIPICDKLLPLVQTRMQTAEQYLIEPGMTYDAYLPHFNRLMRELGFAHRTHDGRHTFASLMDTAGVNNKCIKTIMGHTGGDLTSRVYIHKSLPELLEGVNRI